MWHLHSLHILAGAFVQLCSVDVAQPVAKRHCSNACDKVQHVLTWTSGLASDAEAQDVDVDLCGAGGV